MRAQHLFANAPVLKSRVPLNALPYDTSRQMVRPSVLEWSNAGWSGLVQTDTPKPIIRSVENSMYQNLFHENNQLKPQISHHSTFLTLLLLKIRLPHPDIGRKSDQRDQVWANSPEGLGLVLDAPNITLDWSTD